VSNKKAKVCSSRELQTKNIQIVGQFCSQLLADTMDQANEATNHGNELSFDHEHFEQQYKGQLAPIMAAYLNIPPTDNGPLTGTFNIFGQVIGAVFETVEFALSCTPVVGQAMYSGIKTGHVKTYAMHQKVAHKIVHGQQEAKAKLSEMAVAMADKAEETIEGSTGSPPIAVPVHS
jgi:hypothetical protein